MGSWSVDTSSGFLTNFRGRVTEGFAGTDPRYNNGETTLAQWTVAILEVHQEDYDGEIPEELVISFPVGSDWFSEDGETLEHPKGKERFHVSSIYGKIVANVAGDLEGYGTNATRTDGEELEVDLTPLMAVVEERGTPENVTIWGDLVFDFAEVLFDYGEDRKNKGTRIETRRAMPVAWVQDADADGESGAGAKPAKAAAKKAPAKKAAAAKKAAPKSTPAEDKVAAAKAKAAAAKAAKSAPAADGDNPFAELVEDQAVADTLHALLLEAEDFDSFVAAVVEIPEVVADDDLLAKVIDEDEGPWASRSGS